VLPLSRMPSEPTDAELAWQIAEAGEFAAAAEAALFRRYAPRIALYGRKHLTGNAEAEDLAQQVMLRVLEAIRQGRLEDPSQLASFVFGTCRHVSWDMRRSDQRQRKIAQEVALVASPVDAPQVSGLDVMRLFGCMGQLPEREASVLRMSFMEDRESDDIAARLGLSSGNVRVIRCRALAKVADCMGLKEERA
jgi:RNA polymerase sigma-70 factor, ECF subfamily